VSDFHVISAELAGKIREYLHGEADYDARALLREVVLAQADLKPIEHKPVSTSVGTADSDRLPEI